MSFRRKHRVLLPAAGILLAGCAAPSPEDSAREARLQQYCRESADSPAHYRAKMIRDPYWVSRREALTGSSLQADKAELRRSLEKLESEILTGRNWPHPVPRAAIPFTDSPPRIDGIPRPDEWRHALSYRGEYLLNSDRRTGSETEWKLLYDRKFLYFAVRVFDDAVLPGPADRPYLGDSVELFLHPDRRLADYLEIVVSAGGHLYMTRAAQTEKRHYDLARFRSPEVRAEASHFAAGYCVEGRIPFHILPGYLHGNEPAPGHPMNFMFLRCDRDRQGRYSRSAPVPFLYDGHNIYGYIRGTLSPP